MEPIEIDFSALFQVIIITGLAIVGWWIRRIIYSIDKLKADINSHRLDINEISLVYETSKNASQARKELWVELKKHNERLLKLELKEKNK